MKLPRTTRLFRGQLDWAPFLCVLCPLAFVGLFSGFLVLPRGTRLKLPTVEAPAAVAPGETVFIVAVDSARRCFFENQLVTLGALETALKRRAALSNAPSTLLIQADVSVPLGQLAELTALAQRAGIQHAVFGTMSPTRR
ncbi:MAG TPA: biopolymer transporter ExbD [Verrucomicrobiota bacterium]|nr:biopolymer transporter ExbD [Verrucomicrobiota bacterium]